MPACQQMLTCDIESLAFPHLTETAFAQNADDAQVMTRKFPAVVRFVLISL